MAQRGGCPLTWDARDHRPTNDLTRPAPADSIPEPQDPALPPLNLLDPYFGLDETASGWPLPLEAQREARAMGLLDPRELRWWRTIMTRGVVEDG